MTVLGGYLASVRRDPSDDVTLRKHVQQALLKHGSVIPMKSILIIGIRKSHRIRIADSDAIDLVLAHLLRQRHERRVGVRTHKL